MSIRAYYSARVSDFLREDTERILGVLATHHAHALEEQQRSAWLQQIPILKQALCRQGAARIYLEFYIPRMGKRVDVALIAENIIFLLEFKVRAEKYEASDLRQVEDYALDLKNFHEGSHNVPIVPVLVSTHAPSRDFAIRFADDLVARPVVTNTAGLGALVDSVCLTHSFPTIDIESWEAKGYRPTPTIIQAAEILYRTHSVTDIRRNDAGARNLEETSLSISAVIDRCRSDGRKAICFVTGVPGSGKTLAGMNLATRRSKEHAQEHAVFLSGNGPLVDVLREALTRDKALRDRIPKNKAEREVKSFIQNIHHFRDEYVRNDAVPVEKVVVFDEAQRAWTRKQATSFMLRKHAISDFDMSEPEFLLSVMNRHKDWCTVVCLVGGGQEINTGEAGISEWITALETRFRDWKVYISPRMALPEYGSQIQMERFFASEQVQSDDHLHLSVSMRSFRAESLSTLVGQVIDNAPEAARATFEKIQSSYPLYVTRDLTVARRWLRHKARGTERFGLVASSGALRLRAEGIHVKADLQPPDWFLNDRTDVRSSYSLEDVATEFAVQGLELDWVGVCWDGDFHHRDGAWNYRQFRGTKWLMLRDENRRLYLKNAYRVILTRARQGMVLFVPNGNAADLTRLPAFYDGTFDYLLSCGIPELRFGS